LLPDNEVAPWEKLPTDDPKIREEVTVQILEIAKHPRNILDVPPDALNSFPFILKNHVAAATLALDKDPQLSKLRYSVVPKNISEIDFWRNYFYRVHVIKNAYNLPSTTPLSVSTNPTEHPTENTTNTTTNPTSTTENETKLTINLTNSEPEKTTITTTGSEETTISIVGQEKDHNNTKVETRKGVDTDEEDNKEGFEFASEYYDDNENEEITSWKNSMKDSLSIPGLDPGFQDDLDVDELAKALRARPLVLDDEDDL